MIGFKVSYLSRSSATQLAFAAILFCAIILPVDSQIHWNRGWGAGGSVGKRSLFLAKDNFPERKPTFECSSEIISLASALSKQLQKEIENILICEIEARLAYVESGSAGNNEKSSSHVLPFWTLQKKVVPNEDI